MKKYLIVILAAVVAAAVIFSCKKDDGNDGGGGVVVISPVKMKVSLYEKSEAKYGEVFSSTASWKSDKLSSLSITAGGETTPVTADYAEKKIVFSDEYYGGKIFFTTPYYSADSLFVGDENDADIVGYKYGENGMLKSLAIRVVDSGSQEEGLTITNISVKDGDYTGFTLVNPSDCEDTTYTYTITYSSAAATCPFFSPDFMGFMMNTAWTGGSGKFAAGEVDIAFMSIDALPFFAQKSAHEITNINVKKSWTSGTPGSENSDIKPVIVKDGSNRVTSIEIPVGSTVLAPIFDTGYDGVYTKIKVEFEY